MEISHFSLPFNIFYHFTFPGFPFILICYIVLLDSFHYAKSSITVQQKLFGTMCTIINASCWASLANSRTHVGYGIQSLECWEWGVEFVEHSKPLIPKATSVPESGEDWAKRSSCKFIFVINE
jgi:hypothetical protein